MQTNKFKRNRRTLSIVLFAFGVLLGVAYFGAATWGDIESSLFDPSLGSGEPLDSMKCPVVISGAETGMVIVTLSNPTGETQRRFIRGHISEGFVSVMREINSRVEIEPGGSQRIEWQVTPDDAAWRRVILVRAYLFSSFPMPAQSATCGILVLNFLNLSGGQIVGLILAASLLLLGTGLWLWISSNQPLRGRVLNATYAMSGIALVVLGGMVSSFIGNWMLGVLLLLAAVLLVVVVVTYFFQTS